jgi:hypothetical protein
MVGLDRMTVVAQSLPPLPSPARRGSEATTSTFC